MTYNRLIMKNPFLLFTPAKLLIKIMMAGFQASGRKYQHHSSWVEQEFNNSFHWFTDLSVILSRKVCG